MLKNTLSRRFINAVSLASIVTLSSAANAGLVTENFDDGLAQGWTLTGLWHVTGNNPNGSAGALGYVKDETPGTTLNGNFNTGSANSGTATSNSFLCLTGGCNLSFDSLDSAETSYWDELDVSVLFSGGSTLILNNNGGFNDNTYRTNSFDLSGIVGLGNSFQVQFAFNTIDWIGNNYTGPRIDNFSVSQVSVSEPATLALFGLGLAGLGLSRRKKA